MPATEGTGPRPPIVLVVPARNEQDALATALAEVPRHIVDLVIVADGASTDATTMVARAAGARVIDAGRGYGRACWLGAMAADPDAILVFMDGDGSDRADLIETLVEPILSGQQDFVIASRVRGRREPGSMGAHQILAGLVLGAMIQAVYGVRYSDMCAFRAIRRSDLLRLGMREMTYGWNLEMQMRAAKARLRVLEIAMPYRRRSGGESKVSGRFMASLGVSGRLALTFIRTALRRSEAPG
jgi:glycosyltransferase involved in cell wall biosynthesis